MTLFRPLSIAVTVILVSFRAQAQVPISVACFSPNRAFSESADGKAAIARLSTLEREKARIIDEKSKALQVEEQALEQSAALLTESARAQRTSEVQRFRIDVQRFIEDAKAELMGIQRDAENAFAIRLKPALAKVAEEKGVQLVFNVDAGQIVWFQPSLDITSEVVKQLALK